MLFLIMVSRGAPDFEPPVLPSDQLTEQIDVLDQVSGAEEVVPNSLMGVASQPLAVVGSSSRDRSRCRKAG